MKDEVQVDAAELMLAEWKKRGKPQRERGVDGRFVAGSGAKAPSVDRLGSGACRHLLPQSRATPKA